MFPKIVAFGWGLAVGSERFRIKRLVGPDVRAVIQVKPLQSLQIIISCCGLTCMFSLCRSGCLGFVYVPLPSGLMEMMHISAIAIFIHICIGYAEFFFRCSICMRTIKYDCMYLNMKMISVYTFRLLS